MTGLALALRYLTIAPVPAGGHREPATLGRAVGWFPLVGLGLGLAIAGGEQLFRLMFPPLLDALLTVTWWKLLTGGLHLDGLADCLDGLVGRDAADRLRIMRDSRIGAFGTIGLILFLLLEVAAVVELVSAGRWRPLLAAPVLGRTVSPVVAWAFPAAAPGQGATFRAGLSGPRLIVAAALGVAITLATLGVMGLAAVVSAMVAGLALGWFHARRLGGVTGDVLGAVIEVVELLTCLTVVAWTSVQR